MLKWGHQLSSIEMIKDYELKLKTSCKSALIKKTNVSYYDVNGAWNAIVFATLESDDSSSIIIVFNQSTEDLITGDKLRPLAFKKFRSKHYFGDKIGCWNGVENNGI